MNKPVVHKKFYQISYKCTAGHMHILYPAVTASLYFRAREQTVYALNMLNEIASLIEKWWYLFLDDA